MKEEEKEKYYTPDISEFHVGFEFEIKNREDVWTKVSYPFLGHSAKDLFENSKIIRVKHLDRSDIESLGWEYDYGVESSKGFTGWDKFRLERYEIMLYHNNIVQIRSGVPKKGEITLPEYNGHSIFQGTIKNKSELKRILKQLGI
jgi:hypothetical protein